VFIDVAKLRKKLVKNNGFWKINAIRPKIKAKRGRINSFFSKIRRLLSRIKSLFR